MIRWPFGLYEDTEMKMKQVRSWSLAAVVLVAGVAMASGSATANPPLVAMGGAMMQGGMMSGGTGSSAQSDDSGASGQSSSAEAAFASTCSQCHGLPSASQHTPAQWPAVVQRMEQYMTSSGITPPDATTTNAIVHYLQSQAGGQ